MNELSKSEKIEEIIKVIKSHRNILILTHRKPDGDAVGSVYAMCKALMKNKNNKVDVLFDSYDCKFDVINDLSSSKEDCIEINKISLVLILDCGSPNRLGKYESFLNYRCKTFINIDHHISNNCFGDHNYVDASASSTSEIVYKFIEKIDALDDKIAAAIYAGIVSDTGGFRHSSTSSETHLIVSKLLKFNFNFTAIYNKLMMEWTEHEVKMLLYVLENLELYYEYNLAISYLTCEEIIGNYSVGQFVEFIKNISNIKIAVMITEEGKNFCKVSLRSEKIDVNKIAQKLNGGGHKLASGGCIKSSINEAKKMIIKLISDEYESQS